METNESKDLFDCHTKLFLSPLTQHVVDKRPKHSRQRKKSLSLEKESSNTFSSICYVETWSLMDFKLVQLDMFYLGETYLGETRYGATTAIDVSIYNSLEFSWISCAHFEGWFRPLMRLLQFRWEFHAITTLSHCVKSELYGECRQHVAPMNMTHEWLTIGLPVELISVLGVLLVLLHKSIRKS